VTKFCESNAIDLRYEMTG